MDELGQAPGHAWLGVQLPQAVAPPHRTALQQFPQYQGVSRGELVQPAPAQAVDRPGQPAVDKPVHIRDFHATLLHILGMNHEELTYFHNGLDERLTGTTPASVVHEILA